jgi:hypothetical protein
MPYDPKAWENPDDTTEKPTSDLQIDRELFRAKLLEHWGESRFSEAPAWTYWRLSHEADPLGSSMEVNLQANQQIVSFSSGPKHVFLEFIQWYRAFVPAEYALYLSNSSSWWDSLLLTPETTEQDIVDFTGIIA